MLFVETNNIRLHYLDFGGNGPLMIMMHGLTANAHAFDGLVAEGLRKQFRIVSVDLRGRGLSDHPAFNYDMEDHAQDILGLMDALGADKAIFCGHSFGGLLSFYLGAYYPERVEKLVILDAAARMNPRAAEMLSFRLSTLDMHFPSMANYIAAIKATPYNTFWTDNMLSYYEADVRNNDEGGVTPRPQLANIIQASMGVANIPWAQLIEDVKAPVLLINAPEDYTLDEPLLPEAYARETVAILPNARYVKVAGNHQTMLYGEGAKQIVAAILAFTGVVVAK
jgi:pimeloyl-ACP methyl ester carboxylesterase